MECPKYVQDLVQMQEKLFLESQVNHATCLENRIMKRNKERKGQTKSVGERYGDYSSGRWIKIGL